jgi:radical SAM protein with 4Fe4S-binding SPASM domain
MFNKMKDDDFRHFDGRFSDKRKHYPWRVQVELTYRCNLDCIHCYCKGSEDKERELSTWEWKKNLNAIQKEGCIWLVLTGGEPLVRKDFLEIYSYAKSKNFLIILYTNGLAFTGKIIDYLTRFPPHSMEVTLNGITRGTYEAITQVKGSYAKIIRTLNVLKKKKLPLRIKTNCLKQNKHEIGKIKTFTENFLGEKSERYPFRYDSEVFPRLNGDKTPCQYRLSFEERTEVREQILHTRRERQKDTRGDYPHGDYSGVERNKAFLHRCDTQSSQFIINPYGRLKFCQFSDRFGIDLKTTPLKKGIYEVYPQMLKERFKTYSKCRICNLRPICGSCPGRAYLEIGDEEAPVEYYCELARKTAKLINRNVRNPMPNFSIGRHKKTQGGYAINLSRGTKKISGVSKE